MGKGYENIVHPISITNGPSNMKKTKHTLINKY